MWCIIFRWMKNECSRFLRGARAVNTLQRTVQRSVVVCRQVELEFKPTWLRHWKELVRDKKKTFCTLPPDQSCPLEKAPLGSPQCPQWQCLLSWSPSPQTLFTRNNTSKMAPLKYLCISVRCKNLISYLIFCPSLHISWLHLQIYAGTRWYQD